MPLTGDRADTAKYSPAPVTDLNVTTYSAQKSKGVSIPAGAAGTAVKLFLGVCPIFNSDGDRIGNENDTSLVFADGLVFLSEKGIDYKLLEQLHAEKKSEATILTEMTKNLSTGEYVVDYENGVIFGLKATSGTSDVATFKVRQVSTLSDGFNDSASLDGFGAVRVSQKETLFDSKQLFDNLPLLWDDQEVSGSGTTSTHSTNEASSRLAVSATTAGKRVRQTYQWFNYQPGKGQRVLKTFANILTTSGNTKGAGYGNDDNGLFLVCDSGVLKFIRRTSVSGSPVDNETIIDTTLPDGTVVNLTATQILDVDFEWLGVGRVRAGFIVDGMVKYYHEELNANNLSTVYMSTPNLPLRVWIENDGTGEADTFDDICATVMSEGGTNKLGVLRHIDSGSIGSLGTGTKYAVIGIRLKSGYLGINILIEALSLIATQPNDQLHWEIIFNPTVAGTFTYNDQTNSAVQIATGASTNTVTGGVEIDGGYLSTALPIYEPANNALRLGSAIDGTVDEIVLAVRPLTNNITVEGSLTWRELL